MYFILQLLVIILATFSAYLIAPLLQLKEPLALLACALISATIALILSELFRRTIRNKRKRHRPARPIQGPKREGTIKWFNAKKQYGFITIDGGEDIFVHKRFINGDKRQRIREGMKVVFAVSETDKGLQAEDVSLLE